MLPTPAELRERSRLFREAAGKAVSAETKRQIARCALVFAEVAEAVERDRLGVKVEEHERLLADALEGIGQPPPSEQQPDPNTALRIKRWRKRAEELSTIADGFADAQARALLQRAAANYEKLADQAEARLTDRQATPRGETG